MELRCILTYNGGYDPAGNELKIEAGTVVSGGEPGYLEFLLRDAPGCFEVVAQDDEAPPPATDPEDDGLDGLRVHELREIVAAELVSDRETKAGFDPELKIADRLNESFRNNGLLYRMSGDIMSMNPPLCITRDEVDEIVHAIDLALWKLEGELGISKGPL